MDQVAELARQTDKAVVVIDTFALADRAVVEAAGCALFDDFDRAARAIGQYGAWREGLGAAPAKAARPPGKAWPAADVRGDALSEVEAKAELAKFGVPVARAHLVHTEGEARAAAEAIGGELVLKLVSPDVQHKSEHGFVSLRVEGADAAAEIWRDMTDRARATPGVRVEGVTVEPMLTGGVELLLGCTRDPAFGWLMTVGLGGVFTEVMADVSHRLLPVDATEAEAMLRELKGFRLLTGYRGAPPADLTALRELLLRVSRLVEDVPEIAEMDMNPVIVREAGRGALALDARIRLARPS
jgi:acyl-CoA synthetase (NDP forming)